ncbi:hypothetical protein TUM4438_24540 [Shewanella sairae]|uniref:DNA-binding protein n=1 Tax=Shewanella sairae TaxID=190310 RepID=A0ABQ4PHE9_9GAMM|nr:hypothetical protein [Shewanella sairae]MCL1131328.1 hypothetical protein [Shewanella sairae]GIU46990.1 hypothetical protein TUM4438_24540 [Shewanella sairae]
MSKLTKEEVISTLEAALTQRDGQAVKIEQKGSWYKIDGGKSLRFSDLEAMLAEVGGETAPVEAKTEKKAVAAKPTAKKAPAKKAAPVAKSSGNQAGKTPKELWREKLAGKGQLPRGF